MSLCLVRQYLLDLLGHCRGCRNLLVELALDACRFIPPQVALRAFCADDLAGSRYVEPSLRALVGLHLWHLYILTALVACTCAGGRGADRLAGSGCEHDAE